MNIPGIILDLKSEIPKSQIRLLNSEHHAGTSCETVKRGLQPTLKGASLPAWKRVATIYVSLPDDFENRLTGRRVQKLWRRAKCIWPIWMVAKRW